MDALEQTVGGLAAPKRSVGGIFLPYELERRCWAYAKALVEFYVSIGYMTRHKAEIDLPKQALARMGQCAFCDWAWIDPIAGQPWIIGRPDGGNDVGRVDVKHTRYGWRLIWPIDHKDKYVEKDFDQLVLVTGDNEIGFDVAGWASKDQFTFCRHIAGPTDRGITPGTWFMFRKELEPMIDLPV